MAHIVVLGAGIGGMPAAYDLKAELGPDHRITVINAVDYFQFVPSNPWLAVGWRKREDVVISIAPLLERKGVGFIAKAATSAYNDKAWDRVKMMFAENGVYVEKATGRWVGRLGPWQPEGWPGTEVGWGLAREAWGKGYATEAVQALIDTLFSLVELEAIEADTRVINPASRRVLEKSGFEKEGRLRGYFKLRGRRVDNFLYGLLRDDYLARRRAEGRS